MEKRGSVRGAACLISGALVLTLGAAGCGDDETSPLDRARQAQRQAGSSFKPFVYTSAISTGIPASYVLEDNAVVYPQLQGDDWRPSNFTEEFKGPITIRQGLYESINMIAIKLGWEEVGIETRIYADTPLTRSELETHFGDPDGSEVPGSSANNHLRFRCYQPTADR